MTPRSFATAEPFDPAGVGVRLPRPGAVLGAPLEVAPARAAKGAEILGLHTVGDLIEHLPRDRREARTIDALVPEETATVVVEVRSITSRPVRRRGMKPLVEATVADETGVMKVAFFNQPWLVGKYPPGTRLVLHGKYEARSFRVQQHAPTDEAAGGGGAGDVAHYPATDGLTSTQILSLVRAHAGAVHHTLEPLPARLRVAERLPHRADALAAAHFGDHEGGRRRLAFEELLLLQIALLRRRALRREGARAEALAPPGELTRRWLAESLPFAPTDDQRAAMAAVDADLAVGRPMQRLLMGEVGSGKAQPLDSLVLTPSGFRPMGDLSVGDQVIAPAGETTSVTGVFPQGVRDVWRVGFSDGTVVECDAEHLWQVRTSGARHRGTAPQVKTLRKIATDLRHPNGASKWHVELPQPVDLDDGGARPLDPYLLGLLLGGGSLSVPNRVRFSTADRELLGALEAALPAGCRLRRETHRPYDWEILAQRTPVPPAQLRRLTGDDPAAMVDAYRAGASCEAIAGRVGLTTGIVGRRLLGAGVELRRSAREPSPLYTALGALGLLGSRAHDKHVPPSYLNASIGDRHALLQGLMDTDGTVGKTGTHVGFSSVSERLAADLAWLVRSLGGRAHARRVVRRSGVSWRVSMQLPKAFAPFRLARKGERVRPRTKYATPAKAITSVERVGRKPVQCISVAHPSRLYVTDGFTVTHNTVVAVYAMLRAVESGAQAALMAPTETLAEQHFATLQRLMPGEMLQTALLTGATPASRRADLLGKLATGELKLLVGTHALIEGPVEFDRLAVAVVDEQHRFGVNQRRALDRKAARAGGRGSTLAPHVLHMTATPIPRTLALTAYGDLDVTVLRELPAGRRPIVTHVAAGERERARAYDRMREELRAGRQAFVVCPLVEESEALAARAATAEYERLRTGELRDFRVVLLHGQLRPRDKQEAMADFAAGGADVLVATTVIEVGIDVPNASVMLVENAERYGISQLHQLRGRIGRGPHESVCLLFGPKESARLRALAEHADGFALAEIDLELRGEGEMLGVRQSGLAQFRVARLPEDAELLERARMRGQVLLDADPELAEPEHALLATAVEAAYGAEALEPIPA